MASTVPEPGNWFLRGVQSAIFYYVSCVPCIQFQYQRQRKQEAKADRAKKAQQQDIITTQPRFTGQPRFVAEPGPFQTNTGWVEEIMIGPGPPKGWKNDKGYLEKLQKRASKELARKNPGQQKATKPAPSSVQPSTPPTGTSTAPSSSGKDTISAGEQAAGAPNTRSAPEPSAPEQKLSKGMETLKDAVRSTLHPDNWNWNRHHKEEEVLNRFTEKMTRMWNRATSSSHQEDAIAEQRDTDVSGPGRRRANTVESQRYDYSRGRHPAVNDLHPPVVSQLPATREEAAWMLLGPPSAAVMAGLKRGSDETEMRWPLAVLGGPKTRGGQKPVVARRLSTEDLGDSGCYDFYSDSQDYDDSDLEFDTDTLSGADEPVAPPTTKRVKHFSDPIIRPAPIYSPPSIARKPAVVNRRDSWQFHYVIPSEHQIST